MSHTAAVFLAARESVEPGSKPLDQRREPLFAEEGPDCFIETEIARLAQQQKARDLRGAQPSELPDQPRLGAESIAMRANAAMKDVHSHTLQVLEDLEVKIANLKQAVRLKAEETQQAIDSFVKLADDALRSARQVEHAVDRLAAAIMHPEA